MPTTTPTETVTGLLRTSGEIMTATGKRFYTIEIAATLPPAASDAQIAEAVATGTRIIAHAEAALLPLFDGLITPPATERDDSSAAGATFMPPVDDADLVIHFGRHEGTRLGDIPSRYLAWLVETPARSAADPRDQHLRAAAGRILDARAADQTADLPVDAAPIAVVPPRTTTRRR